MIGIIFIFPILGLKETLNFKTYSSNFPIELLLQTLFFSSVAKKKQKYAHSLQSLLHLFWKCTLSNLFGFQ